MADLRIRINELPEDASPEASDFIPIDGSSTRKTTAKDLVAAAFPVATAIEANEGIRDDVAMTPLKTAEAIEAIGASKFATAEQGNQAATAVQPDYMAAYLDARISDAVSQGNVPIYATVVGMPALEIPVGINTIRVNGQAAAGDGLGGLYVEDDNGSSDTFVSGGATSRTWYRANGEGRDFDITLTVGSGGHFSNVNAALEAVSLLGKARYRAGGMSAEVRLLTGFVMAEQVILKRQDLSWVTITSEDTEVVIQRSALTIEVDEGADFDYPVFTGMDRSRLPMIAVLFNMDTSGSASGRTFLYLRGQSEGYVAEYCGCKNAGARGAEARIQSRAYAHYAIFTGCIGRALYAVHGSEIFAEHATIDSCQGDAAAYALHQSRIDFRAGSANSCLGIALWANDSSQIGAAQSFANSAGGEAAVNATRNSNIEFYQGSATNSAQRALRASHGSDIQASNSILTGAGSDAVYIEYGGEIDVADSALSQATQHGIYAVHQGAVIATRCIIEDCGTAVRASHAGEINIFQASARRHVGRGVVAERGSKIYANDVNAERTPGASDTTEASGDFVLQSNSFLHLLGSTGGVSTTVNAISSRGIAFK